MTSTDSDLLARLDRIADDVLAAHAPTVDAQAAFPKASIDALAAGGFFGVLSSKEVGGLALGLPTAVRVVERVARACGSTAMVLTMHYCGTAVIEAHGPMDVRKQIAAGKHLATLAFSEVGSRSMFWAPTSTATKTNGGIRLDAKKSWCTSAHHATSYVWSSKPVAAEGPSTIWLVPARTKGVSVVGTFDGLGLRGNDSSPIVAEGAVVEESARLGPDGGGFDVMMGIVLPHFQLLNAACSLGMMETAVERTIAHATSTTFEHLGTALRDQPVTRAQIARMRIQTDMIRGLLLDAVAAVADGRADAGLRVLESKAAAADTAIAVLDLAMRVCGGAAFRKEVGVERLFRDTRAATIMAPTSDALHEFIGRAVCGLPLA
ncbi:MAG TPA: acyl-CoA dehydrogenase family protein [Nannocystaceae bacterium]|nr:acyl-CoA dehydrogenase family protein [Nannocystaceae bacterium]